jgi:excisionase family DNA binding protein
MHRQSQFGARENTASERQHASRLAVPSTTAEVRGQHDEAVPAAKAFISTSPKSESQIPIHATPQGAATEGEATENPDRLLTVNEVADLLQVPVSWVYGRTRKRSLDRLPGYRLGKYWRFDREQVLAWVEHHQTKREAA